MPLVMLFFGVKVSVQTSDKTFLKRLFQWWDKTVRYYCQTEGAKYKNMSPMYFVWKSPNRVFQGHWEKNSIVFFDNHPQHQCLWNRMSPQQRIGSCWPDALRLNTNIPMREGLSEWTTVDEISLIIDPMSKMWTSCSLTGQDVLKYVTYAKRTEWESGWDVFKSALSRLSLAWMENPWY